MRSRQAHQGGHTTGSSPAGEGIVGYKRISRPKRREIPRLRYPCPPTCGTLPPPAILCLPTCSILPSLSVTPPLQVPTCYSSEQRQRRLRLYDQKMRITQSVSLKVDKQSKRQIPSQGGERRSGICPVSRHKSFLRQARERVGSI